MLRLLPLLLMASATLGCASGPRYEFRRVGPVRWGEPVNGLQAGLVAQTWREAGEPEFISPPRDLVFVLRNVGRQRVSILEPHLWSGAPRDESKSLTDLRVTPAGGVTRTFTNVLPQPDGAYLVTSLAPGEEYARVFRANFLEDVLHPERPLEVEVVMIYHNADPAVASRMVDAVPPGPVTIRGLWTGAIETGPLKVKLGRQ